MEVMSGHPSYSSLNPNAPIFIPMSYYATVEEFSSEWWDLVQSSPWFRDFWLREYEKDENEHLLQLDNDDDDECLVLPDLDVFFDDYNRKQAEEVKGKRLISMAMADGKWNHKKKSPVKFPEKVPKIVKYVGVTPRKINQPR